MRRLLHASLLVASTLSLASAGTFLLAAPKGGLWGAVSDPGAPSKLYPAEWFGYSQRGFYYGAVSEDPVGKDGELLMEVVNEDGDFHGLVTGKLCGSPQPSILLERVALTDPHNPYLAGCGEDCKWTGFAMYGGEIYFLLAGQYGQFAHSLTVRAEVRKLAGCDDMYPIVDSNPVRRYGDHVPYPVLRCSELVSGLGEYTTDDSVRTGKYMASDPSDSADPSLYFQLSTSGFRNGGFTVNTRLQRVTLSGVVEVVDDVDTEGLDYDVWERRANGGVMSCQGDGGEKMLCHGIFADVRCQQDGGEWQQMQACEEGTLVDGVTSPDCSSLYIACTGSNVNENQSGVWLLDWAKHLRTRVTSYDSVRLPVRAHAILATRRPLDEQTCLEAELNDVGK